MKPYGLRKHDDLDEKGPPTRVGSLKSSNRKSSRRLLHKQARNTAKKEINNGRQD